MCYVLMTGLFHVWDIVTQKRFLKFSSDQMPYDGGLNAPTSKLNVKSSLDYICYHYSTLSVSDVRYDFDYDLVYDCVVEFASTKCKDVCHETNVGPPFKPRLPHFFLTFRMFREYSGSGDHKTYNASLPESSRNIQKVLESFRAIRDWKGDLTCILSSIFFHIVKFISTQTPFKIITQSYWIPASGRFE